MKKDWNILLKRAGFEAWNVIQNDLLSTDDNKLILLAPTGAGKTMAFVLFMLRHLAKPHGKVQALVIVPTRELSQQIGQVLRQVEPSLTTAVLYGGQELRREENVIHSSQPDILVATPGRLLDHLSRGNINCAELSTIIVDEMDKCLELGFLPDIKKILRQLPKPRNLILASATFPENEELKKTFLSYPIHDFRKGHNNRPDIEIIEIPSYEKDKIKTLENLLDAILTKGKTIVFANHRESAMRIHEHLKRDGFSAGLYHGLLDQEQREQALIKFDNGTTPVLVATDLASRGIDIDNVENIVHYHLPMQSDVFTHRNGRTARAGKSGKVFVVKHDEETLPEFINPNRTWVPQSTEPSMGRRSSTATLVFNLGKRDKISRADILGFLTKQIGLNGADIGKIFVGNNYSAVAIKDADAQIISKMDIDKLRIKSKRFKLTF